MNPKEVKKIIFSILKELTDGDHIPTATSYELTNEQFVEIIKLMKNEKYLNPQRVRINILGSAEIDKAIDTVTIKGYNFLEENSKLSKFYKGLKEIKDFIKLS